jgi:hypothetical protein
MSPGQDDRICLTDTAPRTSLNGLFVGVPKGLIERAWQRFCRVSLRRWGHCGGYREIPARTRIRGTEGMRVEGLDDSER